jgi:hypothetical protein
VSEVKILTTFVSYCLIQWGLYVKKYNVSVKRKIGSIAQFNRAMIASVGNEKTVLPILFPHAREAITNGVLGEAVVLSAAFGDFDGADKAAEFAGFF